MKERTLLGKVVRDGRSGLVGKVVGIVTWMDQPSSLVVQPPVRPDQTVPPTAYVVASTAELVPQMDVVPSFSLQSREGGKPS